MDPRDRPWFLAMEDRLLSALPVHPMWLTGIKLLLVVPLLGMALRQVGVLPGDPVLVLPLFLAFAFLDWLDRPAALGRSMDSHLARVVDRVTDLPILAVLCLFNAREVPVGLLSARVGLEALLVLLTVLGRSQTRQRVRSAVTFTTLLALLFLGQGWAPALVTPDLVEDLLWMGVATSTIAALHDVGILQKRLLADALSGANLLCGVFSMFYAARGRVEVSLLFLLLGAAFDGFDGAAARRWGSTPWGVYSDDVADAVNYGVAPGVALYLNLRGVEGLVLGGFYTVFTLGRLLYFTLNKAYADPAFFAGIPSTAGAVCTLCALILFPDRPALVGLVVGVAGIWMVSFDTQYRHLGRALGQVRRVAWGMPLALAALLAGFLLWGRTVPVAGVLGVTLIYGFAPVVNHFREVLTRRAPPPVDLHPSRP